MAIFPSNQFQLNYIYQINVNLVEPAYFIVQKNYHHLYCVNPLNHLFQCAHFYYYSRLFVLDSLIINERGFTQSVVSCFSSWWDEVNDVVLG